MINENTTIVAGPEPIKPIPAAGPWTGSFPIPCSAGSSEDLPRPVCTPLWPSEEPLFKVKILNPKGKVPTKAYEGDLGWDLYAAAPYTLWHGHVTLIQTGIAIQPAKGWGFKIWDRSSMSLRQIFVHGGVYDNGFRGEVTVGLTCERPQEYINEGDKVAQMVFIPIAPGGPVVVDEAGVKSICINIVAISLKLACASYMGYSFKFNYTTTPPKWSPEEMYEWEGPVKPGVSHQIFNYEDPDARTVQGQGRSTRTLHRRSRRSFERRRKGDAVGLGVNKPVVAGF